jgi:heterodisulfide reductase subunit B
LAPCAACYNRSKVADHVLRHEPARRQAVEEAVGFSFTGAVGVRNPLEVVHELIGLEAVHARVAQRLEGLKVVSYYGCLLVRPPRLIGFDDPEQPKIMNEILRGLGANVRGWSYATDCCGGSLSVPRRDVAARLVTGLVRHAREAGATAIVTACPLCQMNLEMRQADSPPMPVFYFTELMGLAFGLPQAASWWDKHLIDPTGVLDAAGLC